MNEETVKGDSNEDSVRDVIQELSIAHTRDPELSPSQRDIEEPEGELETRIHRLGKGRAQTELGQNAGLWPEQ